MRNEWRIDDRDAARAEGGESMSTIRRLRKAMRRNRQQFGMFFGVSRETVRALENGRADIMNYGKKEAP